MKLFDVLPLIGNFHNVFLLLLQVIRNDFKLKQVKCFTDSGCCLLQVLAAVKLEQRIKDSLKQRPYLVVQTRVSPMV